MAFRRAAAEPLGHGAGHHATREGAGTIRGCPGSGDWIYGPVHPAQRGSVQFRNLHEKDVRDGQRLCEALPRPLLAGPQRGPPANTTGGFSGCSPIPGMISACVTFRRMRNGMIPQRPPGLRPPASLSPERPGMHCTKSKSAGKASMPMPYSLEARTADEVDYTRLVLFRVRRFGLRISRTPQAAGSTITRNSRMRSFARIRTNTCIMPASQERRVCSGMEPSNRCRWRPIPRTLSVFGPRIPHWGDSRGRRRKGRFHPCRPGFHPYGFLPIRL